MTAPVSALIDVTLTDLPDGAEAVVERWLRRPGEPVRQHEPLLEVNTDKAVVEVPAPVGGVLRQVLKQPGDPVGPAEVLGRIETTEAVTAPRRAAPTAGGGAPPTAGEPTPAPAQASARAGELSPAVRQLLKKHNLDASAIPGTGRGGRVTLDDVQNYLKGRAEPAGAAPAGRRVPHSATRRLIARHMADSVRTAPHVTAVFEADLSAVLAHRDRHREEFRQKGVPLTYTAYFVAAAVRALQSIPEVNSRWHDDALELFADCNVGVAAATDQGLLVPVIHRAQALDLLGIAARLHGLTERARTGRLAPADLRGGTFTITNHGVSGSLIATPIIHQPQSAILGVGKVEKRLTVVDQGGVDSIQIKPMAYVTLTIDHRGLDGFQANAFLSQFVKALRAW
jgi:2-oxoglutarate dehydrogenase E2 component (dihydrolipoamide succinyltransferase)